MVGITKKLVHVSFVIITHDVNILIEKLGVVVHEMYRHYMDIEWGKGPTIGVDN